MRTQGEETVYRQWLEAGKFCLFNGGLAQINKRQKAPGKTPMDAP
jgi:hypothetical protein